MPGRTPTLVLTGFRLARGLGQLAAPGPITAVWLGPAVRGPGARALARATGARDIALALGALASRRPDGVPSRPWLAAGAVADLADLAGTLIGGRRLPGYGRRQADTAALTTTVLGLALAASPALEPTTAAPAGRGDGSVPEPASLPGPDAQLEFALSAGRAAVGAALVLFPGLAGAWVGSDARRVPVRVLTRAFGGRDLGLGAGALLARRLGEPTEPWLAAGLLADLTDLLSTLEAWSALPRRGRPVVLVAGGAAAVEAVLLARR